MSKIIECLKLLNEITNINNLALQLNITKESLFDLIDQIEQLEPNLIKQDNDKIYLKHKLDWLDLNIIKFNLEQVNLTKYHIKLINEVNSTHAYILSNIDTLADKTVVITERQTQGIGRFKRSWLSKIGQDLTLSIFYFFPKKFNHELMPLIIAVAINRFFKQLRLKTFIKWPNDILLANFEKIAGILVECGFKQDARFITIGIGIDNKISFNRNKALADLIKHVENVINEFVTFGFALLKREWLDNCIHLQQPISIFQNDNLIDSGINIGLTDVGQLIIQSQIVELNNIIVLKLVFKFGLPNSYSLLIDAGNSKIKFAIYSDKILQKLYLVDTNDLQLDEVSTAVRRLGIVIKLGSSVVDSKVVAKIDALITGINWLKPERAMHDLIIHDNISLNDIGSDLYLMALAAYKNVRSNIILVSCGTAFVISLINSDGILIGVKIIPGLNKQLELLENTTAKIKNCAIGIYSNFPKNTASSVISGIIDSYIGSIIKSLNDLEQQDGIKPKLIINGGYRGQLEQYLIDFEPQIYENLVLDGLKYFI